MKQQHRHGRIGGTGISCIVGESAFGGPMDVYRELVEGHELVQTKPMRRGNLMEQPMRVMYVEDYGAKLVTPHPGVILNPKYTYAAASVDDLAERDGVDLVVDYKSAGLKSMNKWGDTDEAIPAVYKVQMHWYMAITGRQAADLAVLFPGGDTVEVYRVERDVAIEEMLLEAGARFWRDHVVAKRPPPPDASEGYTEWLGNHFQGKPKVIIEAGAEAEQLAAFLRQARDTQAALKKQATAAKNKLISMLSERGATTIKGSNWQATCTIVDGRIEIDGEELCKELSIPEEVMQRFSKKTKSYPQLTLTSREP